MIILDANILVRAILGHRVRQLLDTYGPMGVRFFAPDVAFDDMQEHVPIRMARSAVSAGDLNEFFAYLQQRVNVVGSEIYGEFENEARLRLRKIDEDDWPILASSLAMGVPLWTEDRDFFGAGIATWTTDRVEIFLRAAAESPEPSES